MSTPTSNSVGVTFLNRANLGDMAAVMFGTKWGGGYGAGVALTYSFPGLNGSAFYNNGYGSNEFASFYLLSSQERAAVKSVLTIYASVIDVTFRQVTDNANRVGDLRFARFDTTLDEAAHAYFPSNQPSGGDVWFKNGNWHPSSSTPVYKGTYAYLTVLHEVGHALGLKHPFSGSPQLPFQYNTYNYTVMSYSAYAGGDNNATFYPSTPMYFDLLALQTMYGRGVHNPGNTTYTFNENGAYWLTLDDSGGTDTIRSVNNNGSSIELRQGWQSNLGQDVYFPTGNFTNAFLVMIGPNTRIENAVGGNGIDTITGNELRNLIVGGPSGDYLRGLGLGDTLKGGAGGDYLYGGGGPDVLSAGPGVDYMQGDAGPDKFRYDTPSDGFKDSIGDFTPSEDQFQIDRSFYAGVGPVGKLAASRYFVGPTATVPGQRLGYDPATGAVLYDPDSAGPNLAFTLAYVDVGTAITRLDFDIIA